MIPVLIRRLAALGALPDDSDDDRLRKATLVLAASLISVLSFVWVVTYWILGLPLSAAIPLTYQVASVIGLAYFFRTKDFPPLRSTQLGLMLVLPCLLQATLGGFVRSSGVALWASFAPLGALMLLGVARSVPWFALYLGEILALGIFDGTFAAHGPTIPAPVVIALFLMNVTGVTTVTYLIVRYFVRERERAMAELEEAHADLATEQAKSERLLLNVLPEPIAARLKEEGDGIIAERFEDVTVLFADIVGFTTLSEGMAPEDVVLLLDELFTAFDSLAEERGLEKIKTIGDAYMVAGGLPERRTDHATAVADMALAMRQAVGKVSVRAGDNRSLAVRIGIDTGPVVAGVIGRKKFIYDLWGDTVNAASRMESHGLPGEIQVTARTYERLQTRYSFEPRGPVNVKGKGEMDTYLLVAPS